ncbi:uncharacterized protein E5676_scaffold29G00110 [Cucumis melo var. makuwa]|uniref:Uncharacterized protein n=1 Tax=Cucumis melo var. makuwa TaxID=1194695 RepID=A0A5A7UI85_CUCMM|nr:uncharacterized protein E6C27_scaffold222G00750 [Cucumis melo var. makuwa]TYK01332.1 uncharacterized protein E5676_scaffold29G00110 [Cucumis melo var. makuwa]
MYKAVVNGLAEAFNKTLCNLLKKIVSKSKRDWKERIGEALWAYRTTHHTPIEVTPYSLVYDVELHLQELATIDEKRLEAQQALECYQARMSKAFDKHVKPRSFQVGDLELAGLDPTAKVRSLPVEIGSQTAKQNEDAQSLLLGVGFDGKSSIAPSRNQITDGEAE